MSLTVKLQEWDRQIFRIMLDAAHQGNGRRLVKIYSQAGKMGALWSTTCLLGAVVDEPQRGKWLRAACVPPLADLVNYGVKGNFRRIRPQLEDLPALAKLPTSFSFPSGHTTTSFAGVVVIGAVCPRLRIPVVIAASAMGLTRPYLGVHYPSDVAAGAALGGIIGLVALPHVLSDH